MLLLKSFKTNPEMYRKYKYNCIVKESVKTFNKYSKTIKHEKRKEIDISCITQTVFITRLRQNCRPF